MAAARSYIARFASLEGVLAVIVGVGAIVYPIGFVQLVGRVGFGATNDFSTAWLVAGLMPPVQVAGEGIGALAGMWFFFLILPIYLLLEHIPPVETRSLRQYWAAVFSRWRVIGPGVVVLGV